MIVLDIDNKILDDSLSLPVDLRLALIERLIKSLNIPSQPEIDALWTEEAERRIAEVDAAKVQLIPGEQIFKDIRERLQR